MISIPTSNEPASNKLASNKHERANPKPSTSTIHLFTDLNKDQEPQIFGTIVPNIHSLDEATKSINRNKYETRGLGFGLCRVCQQIDQFSFQTNHNTY